MRVELLGSQRIGGATSTTTGSDGILRTLLLCTGTLRRALLPRRSAAPLRPLPFISRPLSRSLYRRIRIPLCHGPPSPCSNRVHEAAHCPVHLCIGHRTLVVRDIDFGEVMSKI